MKKTTNVENLWNSFNEKRLENNPYADCRAIRISDAAEEAGVTRATINNWISKGKLIVTQKGDKGARRVYLEQVEDLIKLRELEDRQSEEKSNKYHLTIKLNKELLEKVMDRALRMNISKSALVREAIEKYLESNG